MSIVALDVTNVSCKPDVEGIVGIGAVGNRLAIVVLELPKEGLTPIEDSTCIDDDDDIIDVVNSDELSIDDEKTSESPNTLALTRCDTKLKLDRVGTDA